MKLQTYQTNALTWRMLVNGAVHPRLVGFDSEQACINRTQALIDNGELRRPNYGAFTLIDTTHIDHPQYDGVTYLERSVSDETTQRALDRENAA